LTGTGGCFSWWAEYARATGEEKALALAGKTTNLVLDLERDPEALPAKVFPETRKTRSHSMTMIRITTLQVLRAAEEARTTSL
jgi:hypothetical protein